MAPASSGGTNGAAAFYSTAFGAGAGVASVVASSFYAELETAIFLSSPARPSSSGGTNVILGYFLTTNSFF